MISAVKAGPRRTHCLLRGSRERRRRRRRWDEELEVAEEDADLEASALELSDEPNPWLHAVAEALVGFEALDCVRHLGLKLERPNNHDEARDALARVDAETWLELLEGLSLERLKAVATELDLDAKGRSKHRLADRIVYPNQDDASELEDDRMGRRRYRRCRR